MSRKKVDSGDSGSRLGRLCTRKKKRFLEAFAKCGFVSQAAAIAGVSRNTPRNWTKSDQAFAAAYADAVDEFCELLEAEADRRAVKGVPKPVYYRGEVCGHVCEYSDVLLMFRLKALKPAMYRDRSEVKTEHTVGSEKVELVFGFNGLKNPMQFSEEAPIGDGEGAAG